MLHTRSARGQCDQQWRHLQCEGGSASAVLHAEPGFNTQKMRDGPYVSSAQTVEARCAFPAVGTPSGQLPPTAVQSFHSNSESRSVV